MGLFARADRHDAVGTGELRHDQPAAALVANQAAENRIGDAGHGREHGRRSDLHGADLERAGNHLYHFTARSSGGEINQLFPIRSFAEFEAGNCRVDVA